VGMAEGRLAVTRLLLRDLPRVLAEERRFLVARARYLAVILGSHLAESGRGAAARRAFLSSLRFGHRPGHVLEVLRFVLAPSRSVVAIYRAGIRATHGMEDGAPFRSGFLRFLSAAARRREIEAAALRFEPIRAVARLRRDSLRSLARAHRRYAREVSSAQYALSLETCAFLDALCRVRRPARILDLGSGFSSYLFRRYRQSAGSGVFVKTVDDDLVWLGKTKSFLEASSLPADGLLPLGGLDAGDAGSYDLVCHDLGDMATRARLLPRALDCAKPGSGVVLIDDVHMDDYRAVVEAELGRRSVPPIRIRETTLDRFGRYAWLVTGLNC
jgi:predicted O-methyltransferase YrrM